MLSELTATVKGNNAENDSKTSNHKLLVIDDDNDILDYLSSELGKHYTVITATNGSEGLQISLSRQPDLVICDVMMPDMDGYEFVRRLKHNPNINDIPVILLTAKGEMEDRVKGLGRGADAYMVKPFHLEELNIRIRNLIDNRLRMRGKYSGQQSQEERMENVKMQSTDDQFMERVMQAVNRHFDDSDYKIEKLAQDVGVSRVHLHRKLKVLTGVSPGEFVRNLRLKQAARLLIEQQGDVTQVAYACGFSSSSVFSTAFKKCYGVSPRTFIDQHNKSKKNGEE
jgi:DNA-binding response OmpR family regulator